MASVPVVSIHMGLAIAVGYNRVDDEGGRVDRMAVSELEHNEGHTLPQLMSQFRWFCVVSLQKKEKNQRNLCVVSILLVLVVEFLCSRHCVVLCGDEEPRVTQLN